MLRQRWHHCIFIFFCLILVFLLKDFASHAKISLLSKHDAIGLREVSGVSEKPRAYRFLPLDGALENGRLSEKFEQKTRKASPGNHELESEAEVTEDVERLQPRGITCRRYSRCAHIFPPMASRLPEQFSRVSTKR